MKHRPVHFSSLGSVGRCLGCAMAVACAPFGPFAPFAQAQSNATVERGFAVTQDAWQYFSLLPVSARLDLGRMPTSGLRIKQSSAAGSDLRFEGSTAGRAPALAATGQRWASADIASSWGRATIGVSVLRSSDGLGVGQHGMAATENAALSLSGTYRLGMTWGLAGQYAAGYSDGIVRWADGATHRLGSQRTDVIALGLFKNETLLRGDRLSLSVGQPVRASSSSADRPYELYDFSASLRTDSMSIRPTTREMFAELNYYAPLSGSMGLGLSLVNRTRANLDSSGPYERILSIRFSTSF